MSKEYSEALGNIESALWDDNFHYQTHKKDLEVIEQALQRLKEIDNANPSEALECLEDMAKYRIEYSDYSMPIKDISEYKKIKQALLKAQEQEKVLGIIKEKNVDIGLLKRSENWLDYYTRVKHKTGNNTEITEEEFDLLRGYFK